MKKLTILIGIMLIAQFGQSQIRMHNQLRDMPHQNAMMKSGCGDVTGIFVDEINAYSATIHWNTNGAAQYMVQYVNMNNRKDKGTLVTPLGSVALDNLTPCATYQFVVIAKCNDGNYKSHPQIFITPGCK